MKKNRALLYSVAFVLALSASFAFKPAPSNFTSAWVPTASCTTPATCGSTGAFCVFQGQNAYLDKGTCTIHAKMQ
jgi:hypothetical protein